MKPLFRCEYCDFTGIEEEVKEHEEKCIYNRTCFSCKHKLKIENVKEGDGYNIVCDKAIEIPSNHIIEFCPEYEKEERKSDSLNKFSGIFGGNIFNW